MLTVLFATHNRASILEQVLESYSNLQPPEGGWKLVVVDNGSSDRTSVVLASFLKSLPLQAISESDPGKNNALNAGLKFIEGDLTVLTDDDVFPSADWLVQVRQVADSHPGFAIFGGPVLPRWEIPPPEWIQWLDIGPILSVTASHIEDGELLGPDVTKIYGPNMAIRSCIFGAGELFDSSIGPKGSSYAMGSETEIVLRLGRQGHRVWHSKKATVEHFVRKEQLTKSWVLERAFRFGRGHHRLYSSPKQWMGIPSHLFLDFPKLILAMVKACVLFRPNKVLQARYWYTFLCGEAYEARLMARDTKQHLGSVHSIGSAGNSNE